jgi:hypothetical protein
LPEDHCLKLHNALSEHVDLGDELVLGSVHFPKGFVHFVVELKKGIMFGEILILGMMIRGLLSLVAIFLWIDRKNEENQKSCKGEPRGFRFKQGR